MKWWFQGVVWFWLGVAVGGATAVPPLSFPDLVATADHIVTGRIAKATVSWGPEHQFLWTRYEVAVEDTVKGAPTKSITVSSPGGTLNGRTMRVPGAVVFTPGEHVTLFLRTFPSGDHLTVGWAQGKFSIDHAGRVHPAARLAGPNGPKLDGLPAADFRQRIVAEQARKAGQ